MAEITRVLRPGGTLGVVWTERDTTTPWVAGLNDLLPHTDWPAEPPGRFALPSDAPFIAPESYEQVSTWTVTPETLMASLGTYSLLLSLPADQAARRLAAARSYSDDIPDPASLVDVPIRTVAYRTRLRET